MLKFLYPFSIIIVVIILNSCTIINSSVVLITNSQLPEHKELDFTDSTGLQSKQEITVLLKKDLMITGKIKEVLPIKYDNYVEMYNTYREDKKDTFIFPELNDTLLIKLKQSSGELNGIFRGFDFTGLNCANIKFTEELNESWFNQYRKKLYKISKDSLVGYSEIDYIVKLSGEKINGNEIQTYFLSHAVPSVSNLFIVRDNKDFSINREQIISIQYKPKKYSVGSAMLLGILVDAYMIWRLTHINYSIRLNL